MAGCMHDMVELGEYVINTVALRKRAHMWHILNWGMGGQSIVGPFSRYYGNTIASLMHTESNTIDSGGGGWTGNTYIYR